MATYNLDDPLADWQQEVNPTKVSSSGNGQMYDDLINSNPYRDLHYRQSPWQRFLGNLGFRTSYDDFVEQAEINAKEYDAGILSMKAQNEYNSPEQEAMRMRSAGLNPDLQGLSDVAESAQPTEDPNGMPAQDSSAQAQQCWNRFQQFGQLIVSSMTAGMSLYKEFIGIDLLKGEIEGKNLENDAKITGIIDSMILENIGGLDQHSEGGSAVLNSIDDIVAKATDEGRYSEYASLLSGYGLSPRQIEQMRPRVAKRAQSILTDENVFNEFAKRNQALSSMKRGQSDEFYTESAWQDNVLDIHIRNLREGQRLLSTITQNLNKHQVSNAESALSNSDVSLGLESDTLSVLKENNVGTMIGQNQALDVLSDTYIKRFNEVLNSTKQAIVNELQLEADKGNRVARMELYYMSLHDFINFDFGASIDLGFGGALGKLFGLNFNVGADAQVHLK